MCCFSAAISKKTSPVTNGGLLAPLMRLSRSVWTSCAELMTGPLQHLVSSRSWEWLRALCGPTSLDVQLLDLTYVPVPLFPARPGAPAGPLDYDAIRRLRPAAEAVVGLQAPQVARLASHTVTLSPVRLGGALVGVMIVAHLDAAAAPSEGHLATVSGWLKTAVEQHLSSQAVGADHLSALNEALRASAFDGSDRRLVSVFAEALAVWHDIEVVGYVETAPGVFTSAVSLAGRSRTAPLVFPPQAVPAPQRLTRMPHTHVDGGDRSSADALVVTLTRSAGSVWLLTLSGEIDACDPALLAGYVSALDITLALTTRAASARVALAAASDLAAAPLDSDRALDRALDRLRQALGASAVRFSTRNATGYSPCARQRRGAAPEQRAAIWSSSARHTRLGVSRSRSSVKRAGPGRPSNTRRPVRLPTCSRAGPSVACLLTHPRGRSTRSPDRSTSAWPARSNEETRSRSRCSRARRRPPGRRRKRS